MTSVFSYSGATVIFIMSALVSYETSTILSDGYSALAPSPLMMLPPPPPPPPPTAPPDPPAAPVLSPTLVPPVETVPVCFPTVNGESEFTVPDTLLFALSIVMLSTVTHFPPV